MQDCNRNRRIILEAMRTWEGQNLDFPPGRVLIEFDAEGLLTGVSGVDAINERLRPYTESNPRIARPLVQGSDVIQKLVKFPHETFTCPGHSPWPVGHEEPGCYRWILVRQEGDARGGGIVGCRHHED